jgi:hypothetical protein
MAQERAFLTTLEAVTRWTIDGGMLDMHRADDERALSAKPVDVKSMEIRPKSRSPGRVGVAHN